MTASLQQPAGGLSVGVAGVVIVQMPDGHLEHLDWLGYIVVAVALVTLMLMYSLHEQCLRSSSLRPKRCDTHPPGK